MVQESNIDLESNIELATKQVKIGDGILPTADISGDDFLKLDGWVLHIHKPILFDVRSVGYDGSQFRGTEQQWQEYIDALPCSRCKKHFSGCKC